MTTDKNLKNELTALKKFNTRFPGVWKTFIYDINCDDMNNDKYTKSFQRKVVNAMNIHLLEELYIEMKKYKDIMVDYTKPWHMGDGIGNKIIWKVIKNLNKNITFLNEYIKEQKGKNQ